MATLRVSRTALGMMLFKDEAVKLESARTSYLTGDIEFEVSGQAIPDAEQVVAIYKRKGEHEWTVRFEAADEPKAAADQA